MINKQEKSPQTSINFYKGDIENMTNLTPVHLKKYNMVTCIEAWHTLPNTERALNNIHRLLESQGELLIADGFAVDRIEDYEAEFKNKFTISQKIDITLNVRNARYLSVERQKRIMNHGLHNSDTLQRVSNLFYSLLPEEQSQD